ncbi:hypothetical protein RHMOL_Rhmol13G0158100 [Rhododendron molle]|uniref:Uncharacterized protein n=1 Tax=Rhododendron molle TaxID=49168 RepID=A0ACC0L8L7_RHOML|nr:hypothetical protein RHMOL_Rhmol13G0158100 [Rhododendron molle]
MVGQLASRSPSCIYTTVASVLAVDLSRISRKEGLHFGLQYLAQFKIGLVGCRCIDPKHVVLGYDSAMGKSPGKWIKTVLFGKKSSKSNVPKGRERINKQSTVEGLASLSFISPCAGGNYNHNKRGMPTSPYIYANDLIEVLKKKHASGTYKSMVIYSSESGSIFEGLLPEGLNIYATTASNAEESSWGTYCPGEYPSPPEEYETCLGDLYSVAWMEGWQLTIYGLAGLLEANREAQILDLSF